MGKGHDDAHDRTHVGWKRDMNLTLITGQELPEVLFGDCSLEVCVRLVAMIMVCVIWFASRQTKLMNTLIFNLNILLYNLAKVDNSFVI